jgi:hypothetical protein
MGRAIGLSLLLSLFAFNDVSRASVRLQVGDTVTFNGQALNQSEGYGGAFNWQITSTVPSPPSSPIATQFQSYCDEAQQEINAGTTYTITDIVTPILGQVINSSGNLLNNFKGIYLFDEWADATMAHTSANAAAVQITVWESEGYNLTANNDSLLKTLGYSQTQYTSAESLITYWLGRSLMDGETYSSSWTSSNVKSIELTSGGCGAQDQLVIVPTTITTGSSPVPEPGSIVIWGIGAGLVCMASSRRCRSEC